MLVIRESQQLRGSPAVLSQVSVPRQPLVTPLIGHMDCAAQGSRVLTVGGTRMPMCSPTLTNSLPMPKASKSPRGEPGTRKPGGC